MATPDEIKKIFNELSLYYRQETTPEVKAIYLMSFVDTPAHVLRAAVDRHIAECKWFPKVSELLEQARKVDPGDVMRERVHIHRDELNVLYFGGWPRNDRIPHPVDCPCLVCAGMMTEAQALEMCNEYATAVL